MRWDVPGMMRAAELVDAIEQLHVVENLTLALKLDAIAAYDRSGAWRSDGATSITAWVAYALGVKTSTASDYVRVARALPRLPLLSIAFREGRLCFDQVQALVRVATARNEAELVDQATGLTATQIEALVRRLRPVATEAAAAADDGRWLRFGWSEADRCLRLSGRLPAAEGAMVVTAVERIAHRAEDRRAPLRPSHAARCADALVELACSSVGADADPGRPTVVVHVDAEALRCGEEGHASVEGGVPLAAETVRRLACDARMLLVTDGPDGRALGVGRRSRTVPTSLLRVLRHRDTGCRFPGCNRTRWVHAHHRRHWADGGTTDLDNLVLLCGAHHRFVHEHGLRIEGDPGGELRFFDRRGLRYGVGPPGLRPGVRARLAFIPDLPRWLDPALPHPPPVFVRR
jgi:hypothetical protein